jgi:predicted MFS family arabinose efflux permease
MSRARATPDAGMTAIIVAGSVALALAFGARSVFGVVIAPLSADLGWPRETFALSLAIQNLVWGLAQPGFGMLADRWGDRPALWLGYGLYLAGMLLAATGDTVLAQHLGAGALVGLGVSGTAFGLVLSVVGRAAPEHRRSQALGLVAALGAAGQVFMPPLAQAIAEAAGWRWAVAATGALLLPIAFCIPFLKAPAPAAAAADIPLAEALRRAFGHADYVLLVLGFFVCGFHVAFITAHFPAYVAEVCAPFMLFGAEVTPAALGAATISVVGAANVAGTMLAGQLGARHPKPYLLSAIYGLRAVVILAFVAAPPTPATVIAFSVAMGLLWLSTVPLTTGLVATMFGPRFMATLYGFVFLSHQLGSFAGVWLGGRVYDLYGSYDLVWQAAIGLGVFSALVHLPIRERAWAPRPA